MLKPSDWALGNSGRFDNVAQYASSDQATKNQALCEGIGSRAIVLVVFDPRYQLKDIKKALNIGGNIYI